MFGKKKEKEESYLDWKKREYNEMLKEDRKHPYDKDLKKGYKLCLKALGNDKRGRENALLWIEDNETKACMSIYTYAFRYIHKDENSLVDFPISLINSNNGAFLNWTITFKTMIKLFDDKKIEEEADILKKTVRDMLEMQIYRYDKLLEIAECTEEELNILGEHFNEGITKKVNNMGFDKLILNSIDAKKAWQYMYEFLIELNQINYENTGKYIFDQILILNKK